MVVRWVGWLFVVTGGWLDWLDWLVGWLVGWNVGWLFGWFAGGLVGRLTGWQVSVQVGWRVGWLVGWSLGGLVGWLTRRRALVTKTARKKKRGSWSTWPFASQGLAARASATSLISAPHHP